MSLLSIRQLLARNAFIRRLAARTLAAFPALDLWTRNRIGNQAYRPSLLQVDAQHLPEASLAIFQALLASIDKERRP